MRCERKVKECTLANTGRFGDFHPYNQGWKTWKAAQCVRVFSSKGHGQLGVSQVWIETFSGSLSLISSFDKLGRLRPSHLITI